MTIRSVIDKENLMYRYAGVHKPLMGVMTRAAWDVNRIDYGLIYNDVCGPYWLYYHQLNVTQILWNGKKVGKWGKQT